MVPVLALALSVAPAMAAGHHPRGAAPPTHSVSAQAVVAGWREDGGWRVSPARWDAGGGVRMGAHLQGVDGVEVQVQGVGWGDVPLAEWVPARRTWRGDDGQEVWVADLPDWAPASRVRVPAPARFDTISWELVTPVDEPRGPPAPPAASAVSTPLADIGVVSREDWGASATTCSSTEDDWYRFAIHHTAGGQTSGGTVQGAVQALQAYAMGTGTYCDIPYQFLVGHDGSLWEGRPLAYTSGATGGNNDGNIAICFLGCYDSSACGSLAVAETVQMMAAARLLAQTLAVQEATTTTASSLIGHRDYPENYTVCPGDLVHGRLGELRSADAHFQAAWVADDAGEGGVITVDEDSWAVLTLQLRNTGLLPWTANTRLAPLPRDIDHPLSADWESPTRVGALPDTAPGETATIQIPLDTTEAGTFVLDLGLVEEWVTWFDDAPIGGGPVAGALSFVVEVQAWPDGPDDTGEATHDSGGGDGADGGSGGGSGGGAGGGDGGIDAAADEPRGNIVARESAAGCGCAAAPASAPLWAWLGVSALALVRRRR